VYKVSWVKQQRVNFGLNYLAKEDEINIK